MINGSWTDVFEDSNPEGARVALSLLVSQYAAKWRAEGAEDIRDHVCERSRAASATLATAIEHVPGSFVSSDRCDTHALRNRATLVAFCDELGLEPSTTAALCSSGESLLSCFARLEHRVDFLALLKDPLGVDKLPTRQKIANALLKRRRAEHERWLAPSVTSSEVILHRTPRPSPSPPETPPAPPPPASRWRVVTIADDGDGATTHATELRGYVVTARGEIVDLNRRAPSSLTGMLARDGPVMSAIRQVAAAAGMTLAVLPPRLSARELMLAAAPPEDRRQAPQAASLLELKLGCTVHVLLTAQRETYGEAYRETCGETQTQGEMQGEAHGETHGEVPLSSSGCCQQGRTCTIPLLDALSAPAERDDWRVARRRLAGRRLLAVWRGGCDLGGEGSEGAAGDSLRARLVRHCQSRGSLYDVGFTGTAPPLSQRAQSEYRVRLLVDSCGEDGELRAATWDAGWPSALASGSVLLVVGEWRPPVVGLALGEHYVQAADDLSDLDARVEWALRHPDATAMAGRAAALFTRATAQGFALRAAVQALAPLVGVVQAACADRGNHEPPDGIADGRSDGRAKKHLTC